MYYFIQNVMSGANNLVTSDICVNKIGIETPTMKCVCVCGFRVRGSAKKIN